MKPEELRFTSEHEWVEPGQAVARVGISDYAQKELTDVVYVELPGAGREVKAGEAIVVLESVKATTDVYAPAPGKISAVNDDLQDNPQKINEDPYGEGWLVKLEISDPSPIDKLMDYPAYEEYLKGM